MWKELDETLKDFAEKLQKTQERAVQLVLFLLSMLTLAVFVGLSVMGLIELVRLFM